MAFFERFAPEYVWMRIRPDAIHVWSHPEVLERLRWYYSVMTDQAPAKFMLAKVVEVDEDEKSLQTLGLEELLRIRERYVREHRSLWAKARNLQLTLEDYRREFKAKPKVSLLHVDALIAQRLANPCNLCERRCRVDRTRRIGACRVPLKTYVHSWFHHLGEESPLVPSGTIFYGGCNFTCVFCQNFDISQQSPRSGDVVDAKRLAQIQAQLRLHGARNINHVGGDPTPSLHTIVESMLYLDVNVPQLWNSNMYMSLEAMLVLTDIIDIWLPDFKYGNDKCAARLSAVPRYMEVVTRNLKLAAESGDMIIRHLVLPGHLSCCTMKVLEWIASNLPKDRILVNIMEQYRPENLVAKYPRRWPELARRPSPREMELAYEQARRLGILFEPVS